jgi:hypothetical protein
VAIPAVIPVQANFDPIRFSQAAVKAHKKLAEVASAEEFHAIRLTVDPETQVATE